MVVKAAWVNHLKINTYELIRLGSELILPRYELAVGNGNLQG